MSRTRRRPARPPADQPAAPSSGSPGARPDARPIEGALAGYRVLRRIASGDRADVYLAVVEPGADDESAPLDTATPRPLVVLRVYSAAAAEEPIATEIEVMGSDAAGSTPALLDVAAFDDGRTCLAVERIAGPVLTQLLSERSLSSGEAVTVLAPIVQAVRELEQRGFVHPRLSAADVLLDERGRPRLAGLGAVRRLADVPAAPDRVALLREGEAALLRLVGDVAAVTKPTGALDGCRDVLESSLARRPFATCAEELERALFRIAAPEPIAGVRARNGGPMLPARIGVDAPSASAVPSGADQTAGRAQAGGLARLSSIAQLPDALVGDLAAAADSASTRALRARLAAFAGPRRRTLLFAGAIGAAALVTLLALVPPAGVSSPDAVAVDDVSRSGAPPTPSVDPERPSGSAELAGVAGEVDPVAAAGELLEVRASCVASRDLDCLGVVAQPGSPIAASDRSILLDAGSDGRAALEPFDLGAIALVADMGSAVLLEVPYADAEREPASLLMMRSEAGWRLRELFG